MRISERDIHFQKSYSIYEGGIQNELMTGLEAKLENEERSLQFND